MIKRPWLFFYVSIVFFIILSCGQKKVEDNADWEEMDKFHMIMADAFHPYKDSANLEPAKANAAAMAEYANQWAKTSLPEKVNREEVKQKLAALDEGCREFVEVVKTDDSQKIGESLNDLHDLFHSIQEEWYSVGADHHHHKH